MSIFYLDTSVALHAILPGGDPRARIWIDEVLSTGSTLLSSTLLELETLRALRREGLPINTAGALLDRVALIRIDDGTLRFAGAIETHLKSLDAIHMATCALLDAAITLVTRDQAMHVAAGNLGIASIDPLLPQPDA